MGFFAFTCWFVAGTFHIVVPSPECRIRLTVATGIDRFGNRITTITGDAHLCSVEHRETDVVSLLPSVGAAAAAPSASPLLLSHSQALQLLKRVLFQWPIGPFDMQVPAEAVLRVYGEKTWEFMARSYPSDLDAFQRLESTYKMPAVVAAHDPLREFTQVGLEKLVRPLSE